MTVIADSIKEIRLVLTLNSLNLDPAENPTKRRDPTAPEIFPIIDN